VLASEATTIVSIKGLWLTHDRSNRVEKEVHRCNLVHGGASFGKTAREIVNGNDVFGSVNWADIVIVMPIIFIGRELEDQSEFVG